MGKRGNKVFADKKFGLCWHVTPFFSSP
jgi:hypothetical protein